MIVTDESSFFNFFFQKKLTIQEFGIKMGKKRKRQSATVFNTPLLPSPTNAVAVAVPSGNDTEDALDLQITTEYLSSISHTALATEPKYKDLRRIMFSIMNSLNPSIKPIQKVSNALESLAFDSALMALAQIRAEETVPKLGSVQRWVRQAGTDFFMEWQYFFWKKIFYFEMKSK